MSMLDAAVEAPWRIANLTVAFPNQANWSGSHRGNYASARDAHFQSLRPQLDAQITASPGRVVLGEIRNQPKFKVKIFPFEFDPDYAADRTHTAARSMPLNPDGAVERSQSVDTTPPKGPGQPDKRIETTYTPGSGTDVNIFYTVSAVKPPYPADMYLLHELTHACRLINGRFIARSMNGGYGNAEEFIATLVSNMFQSRKNRPLYDYHARTIDPRTFLTSGFTPSPTEVLGLFRAAHASLFFALKDLTDVPFNPIRQLFA